MNPKEKAHPFFYVLTMQKIYISRLSVTTKKSRTRRVPRPLAAGCHGEGEAGEAGETGRCSPQRGPNQKGFG